MSAALQTDGGGHGGNGRALVEVRELHKTYHLGEVEVPAVRGVNLSVSEGEFVSIMGPSGSGKSTFLYLIGCLDRCDRGDYRLAGAETTRLSNRELAALRNRRIGFVFQNFNLLSRTSVLDNVALPLAYAGVKRRDRRRQAAQMIERVGLSDRSDHLSNQLSGGQQQRVAIARALITRPLLFLADEPTGNLDSRTSVEIMTLLQELNRDTRLTILLVTHELDVALFGRRMVSFMDGRISSDYPIPERRETAAATVEPS